MSLFDRRGQARTRVNSPGGNSGRTPENKGKSGPPTLLERSEVEALLAARQTAPNVSPLTGPRIAAYIAVAYRTGLHVGEALGLHVGDYKPGRDASLTIRSRRKSGNRTLALDRRSCLFLDRWLKLRAELPGTHIFCVTEGPSAGLNWEASSVRVDLNRAARAAGITKSVNPRALRHTCAAELFAEQWPMFYIQAQLGIESLSSMEDLYKVLAVNRPSAPEVLTAARLRPPWPSP